MNQVLLDVGIQIAAYITVILLGFVGMNWLTNGFLWPSLRVKLSRGRLTLVFVNSLNGFYYVAGKLSGGFLIYTDKEKNKHRVSVDNKMSIGYIGATKTIIVDEATDKVYSPEFKEGGGFDGVKYENLFIRCLMSPEIQDKVIKIILLASVIAAIASLIALWLIYMQGIDIAAIKQTVTASVV
jgi:hypothetical protein